MIKRLIIFVAAFALTIGLLSGCGSDKVTHSESGSGYVPKKLTIGFVPSQNAETLEARAKPLADLLSKKLNIPVKVTVTTDYNAVVQALKSKQLDLGFLPPTDYVIAHKQGAADVLLQAQRYGVIPENGKNTNELVDYYCAIMLVKKDSNIKDVKDLKGKKVAWQSPTSSAGYVWPAIYMKEHGIDAQKDVTGIQVQGHDKAISALMNGDVDAAAVFLDARNIVAKEYPDIWDQTRILFKTEKIPNDTISVRPDMSVKWKKKISDAFVAIGKDPEGQKIILNIYSHVGYIPSKDANFDIVREYNEKIKEIGK
ncbi:phosphate/phosphite/phosphonate ABC transporter substrate-binding protein [Bacillus smithii]|uniref:phosphate/phosphite/phosphonate ABC transporter substrate-binding protein n=1 Tax=Bacillus smithii TaxID=1479 RepID=UPI002E209B44|nr:phosphate/phosphite/phosphonate ABC transporter substrate-binding protein [Bacillus smithii]MED1455118.1 phosphate/phosphite/phosphonate ABC transporter substrate-binding protein [Bacillus smithii]MED1488977.1 phosphate/phosphite/phosphonate ABC transporter substrate-binding protein [Bacillus smithii]